MSSWQLVAEGPRSLRQVTIREMRESDIDEVSRIVCESFRCGAERDGYTRAQINAYCAERGSPEMLRAQFTACQWLVACIDGAVVGVVSVKGNEIDKLYVSPGFLRQGIGRRLFCAAEELIARSGHAEIVLSTVFPASLPLYHAMGMIEVGRKTIVIGPCRGRESIMMRKPI